MPGARQLLGASHARRPGADYGDLLAGLRRRQERGDPALVPAAVDDRAFYGFDRHRVFVDVERAGGLARRRADAAGEFREVVGRVQDGQRVLPLVAVDQVVPVRDDVVDWAAVMAERDAAIHAARSLRLEGLIGQRLRELAPRMDPLRHLLVVAVLAFDLEEPGRLAHAATRPRPLGRLRLRPSVRAERGGSP